MSKKCLYLVDASSYIFRAFFASPPMRTSTGKPTNALYVFTRMLLALFSEYKPDEIGIVFDAPGRKFRHDLYEDYKANRPPLPEDLAAQMPYFRTIVEALGLAHYEMEGFEADDVIATLSHKALEAGYKVRIISSDKDLMQMIRDDCVEMLDTMSRPPRLFTEAEVLERFQVEPARVVDVLALAGDSADNIPGAKGIGEKTAGMLIAEYGSLENLMLHAEEIKANARRNNLLAFRDIAARTKKLVQLVTDLPIELINAAPDPDVEQIHALFKEFEFKALNLAVETYIEYRLGISPEVGNEPSLPQEKAQQHLFDKTKVNKTSNTRELRADEIEIVCEASQWLLLCEELSEESTLSMHVHGFGKEYNAQVLGISIVSEERQAYGSLAHRDLRFSRTIPKEAFYRGLEKIFLAPCTKVVHGFKKLSQILRREGVDFALNTIFDIELAAYLQFSEMSDYGISKLSVYYTNRSLNFEPKTWLGTGKKAEPLESVGVYKASEAAAEWALCGLEIYHTLAQKLVDDGLDALYKDLERPLTLILAAMESEGIGLDLASLNELSRVFGEEMQKLEIVAYQLAGRKFNILSPKQVGELLYDELGLKPKRKKSRQHGLSTDQESLESLVQDHPLPKVILDYRSLAKLHTTYSTSIAGTVDPDTQRVHGLFHQSVAATGRLSSSEPNLQNIPGRSEIGRKIRACFVSRPQYSFIAADYSQIELRIMAHLSQEPVLLNAFKLKEDIHLRTAALIFGKDLAEVSDDERRVGKTINFGVLYGMGFAKMARETGYSNADAKKFIELYHQQFPKLEAFFKQLIEDARKQGFVTTILGRRRYTPEIQSSRLHLRALAERTAVNSPIQGSAADLIKLAMLSVNEAFKRESIDAKILIQVHDELIIECADEELDRCKELIRDCMMGVYELSVPLVVNMQVSKHWE
ncbi:MAG: DNA polymerase I [Bradymonadales bacterium]|jgi:DNA polymerase-1